MTCRTSSNTSATLPRATWRHSLRPLQARVAKDNAASIRVLLRCGFVACGEGRGFAEARGEEIDELIFRLDEAVQLEVM